MCQTRFKLKIGHGGTFFLNVCCKLALKQRNQRVFHQNTLLQTQTHNRNDNDKVKKICCEHF